MIRKLVSLPEDLDMLIALTAQQEKKSKSEVVRERLRAGFATMKHERTGGDGLLELARLGERMGIKAVDPNLSRTIDKYLYEDL